MKKIISLALVLGLSNQAFASQDDGKITITLPSMSEISDSALESIQDARESELYHAVKANTLNHLVEIVDGATELAQGVAKSVEQGQNDENVTLPNTSAKNWVSMVSLPTSAVIAAKVYRPALIKRLGSKKEILLANGQTGTVNRALPGAYFVARTVLLIGGFAATDALINTVADSVVELTMGEALEVRKVLVEERDKALEQAK